MKEMREREIWIDIQRLLKERLHEMRENAFPEVEKWIWNWVWVGRFAINIISTLTSSPSIQQTTSLLLVQRAHDTCAAVLLAFRHSLCRRKITIFLSHPPSRREASWKFRWILSSTLTLLRYVISQSPLLLALVRLNESRRSKLNIPWHRVDCEICTKAKRESEQQ